MHLSSRLRLGAAWLIGTTLLAALGVVAYVYTGLATCAGDGGTPRAPIGSLADRVCDADVENVLIPVALIPVALGLIGGAAATALADRRLFWIVMGTAGILLVVQPFVVPRILATF